MSGAVPGFLPRLLMDLDLGLFRADEQVVAAMLDYTGLLVAGASAGILLPAEVSTIILRPLQRRITVAAVLIAAVFAIAIMGITTT